MKDTKFSWKKRARSCRSAFAGIARLLRYEHNAWIHCAVSVVFLIAGFVLPISAMEWVAVALCIGGVVAAEEVSSAVEAVAERVSPGYDEAVKHTKDLAAGAVLLMAMAAGAVGLIIFVPKISEWIG